MAMKEKTKKMLNKLKTIINIIRRFLVKNKVFFETIAAISLSIMAILISNAELKMQKIQTEIAKQSIMPHFVIRARQIKEPNSQIFEEDVITVENEGSIISNLICKTTVLLDVELSRYGSVSENFKNSFFLNGYYFGFGYSPNGKGLLLTIKGYKNNLWHSKLDNDFANFTKIKSEFGHTDLRRFLNITYTDQLGENHNEYYYVPLIYGASRISEKEGETIFSNCNKSIKDSNCFECDNLNAENLYSRVAR